MDSRLIDASDHGDTKAVKTLLAAGANVHVEDDCALRWAACRGYTETVKALLAAGANVHARDDEAMRGAADCGYTETMQALARHIFAPDSWYGKSRGEIEAAAEALYHRIIAENPHPDHLRQAGSILLDCALCCWEQVRPPPPKLQISPLPAQPRPA